MKSSMKNSEVLYGAAEAVRVHGWTRGERGMDPTYEGLCVMGALGKVADVPIKRHVRPVSTTWYPLAGSEPPVFAVTTSSVTTQLYDYAAVKALPAYWAVKDYLVERDGFPWAGLWQWNDGPTTTAEEVIEVLLAVAAIEEAKEILAEATERPALDGAPGDIGVSTGSEADHIGGGVLALAASG